MPKTRKCGWADKNAIIAKRMCPVCGAHTISLHAGGNWHDDEFHFSGVFWSCNSGKSWEHFMLSPGSGTQSPRITAGFTLPSERVAIPYDRAKAVVRHRAA